MDIGTRGIAPCLWFDRQAEEAAAFYVSVFAGSAGGSRLLGSSRYPDDDQGREGEVMTVEFELDGQHLTALNGGPQFTFSEAISFQIPCADQAAVDHYWQALTADGGQEGPCGWCKDRYGVSWQIVPTSFYALMSAPDPAGAKAAMQAMYGMKKLVLADLQRAYDEAAGSPVS